jgi:hypothetical protein
MSNFKIVLGSFAAFSLALWLLVFAADSLHPRLSCFESERNYWTGRERVHRFERVSSFFWSSLCADPAKPVIISASEGTGDLSFAQVARGYGVTAHEFTGAHRGLKTLAYMLASDIHPERLERLRVLAFINPVYFSFAARTDASSVSLTAISNLSYFSRLHSFHQKWDEFLPASLFIGAKSYFDELSLFSSARGVTLLDEWPDVLPPAEGDYDFDRHMLKSRVHEYTSFRSKFSASVEPGRYLFDSVVKFAHAHPEANICYVMLPTNLKNLKHFGRDAEQISREMRSLVAMLPEGARIDLGSLDEEKYIFQDPMHMSDYGKRRVMEEVMKTSCAQKLFGRVAP